MKNKIINAVLFIGIIIISSCSQDNQKTEKKENAETSLIDSNIIENKEKEKDSIVKIREFVIENDYDSYSKKLIIRDKDLSEIKKWLRKTVMSQEQDRPPYMTKECAEFTYDVIDNAWGYNGSIDEITLKKKWSNKYDLKYSNFGHLFETGNGGWGTKQLSSITYLGELNQGDWFKLEINGGPLENDYSEKLVRVVKVIFKNNRYYIDNFLSLSGG
jgi:hypothetical protein